MALALALLGRRAPRLLWGPFGSQPPPPQAPHGTPGAPGAPKLVPLYGPLDLIFPWVLCLRRASVEHGAPA
eukprot:6396070-Pyramimonas_sp.AAC.1